MRLSFTDCLLDTDARQVHRAGSPVHLSAKAYELLRILADARPRALSKEGLYAQLWPDTFVVEANLANLVVEIRTALGDDARHPRVVRTVHRFGYAFCADARDESKETIEASCCLAWNDRRFELGAGDNVIGREHGATVRLDFPSVSRRHAVVRVTGRDATIEDLGSKNGTLVRGQRAEGRIPLRDGDAVQIGSLMLTFHAWSPDRSTETVAEARQ